MGLQSTSILAGITNSLINIRQNERAAIGALRNLSKARNEFTQFDYIDPNVRTARSSALSQRNSQGSLQVASAATRAQVDNGIAGLETVLERLDEIENLATNAAGAGQDLRKTLQGTARSALGEIAAGLGALRLSDQGLRIPVTSPRETLAGVTVTRIDRPIDGDGLDFDFEIDTAATNAQLFNSIDLSGATTPGVTDGDVSFEISGADGLNGFSFSAGSTINDIAEAINAATSVTGVEAEVSGNGIDLAAREVGSSTITIQAIDDPQSVITNASDRGDDTIINIDVDGGFYAGIEGDGLRVAFDIAGVEGFIDVRADAVDTDIANVTVREGGKAAVGADGRAISRFGFSATDFGLLGAQRGGLGAIDLINDPSQAIRIIQAARADVTEGLQRAVGFRDAFLDPQVETTTRAVGELDQAVNDLDSVRQALTAVNRVRSETQISNAFSILAQNGSLFTASAVSLL